MSAQSRLRRGRDTRLKSRSVVTRFNAVETATTDAQITRARAAVARWRTRHGHDEQTAAEMLDMLGIAP